MVQVSVLLALVASVSAVPLNINLGAYSPALVVGDGEISFGGKADVTGLMNALEGAAVSGAAANAAAAPAAAASAAPAATSAAAAPAAAAVAPTTEAATTSDTTQITALQGMGKEIAPRIVQLTKTENKAAKRDLSGFDRALQYAAAALKTAPEVELGTGEGGSGVGITQKAGGTTATTKAAKRAEPFTYDAEGNEIEKRTEPFTYDAEGNEIEKRATGEAFHYGDEKRSAKRTEMKTTVTTMYIRGGVSAGVSKTFEGSPAQGAVTKRSSKMQRRAPSAGIDGVNLNVNDGQGVTLTFVETKAADDED